MGIEFTKEETQFLLNSIDQPVTIKPSQMPSYYQLVMGVAGKLQPQPQPQPEQPQQPETKQQSTADDLKAAMEKIQKTPRE